MDFINGRSMELLRRLGLAKILRERGIDPDHSTDFLWTRTFAEPPLMVWHYPSVAELRRRYVAVNDGSAPAEAHQRIQGSLLEELLRDCLREHPLIELCEGWTFTGLQQCQGGVIATMVEAATGVRHVTNAKYVAACDGARSTVRECLEIPTDNVGSRTQFCSIYFRSKDPVLRKHGRAFVTVSAGLTLVSRDEDELWTCSIPVPADEPFTGDPMAVVQQRLGESFQVDEIRSIAQWEGALAVARTYRRESAFLVGDAAHQFYPTGGFGANTGIADAVDLGWKLAAALNGWGGPGLLDSYERERRPVALFNREMCANLLEVWRRFTSLIEIGASPTSLAGYLEQEVYQVNNSGLHFDYRYDNSPIIWPETGKAPEWRWDTITPTTWPGCRVPAVRLADGGQIHDKLGTGLTLVDLSGRDAGAPLARLARAMGIPMTYLALTDPALRGCWGRDLVLVRPDHHVAWRGDLAPIDWEAVLHKVTGHDIDR
jgi:2-polyprenyl-6-methoxyphenol hydroxylase-like FAD-dependent oxidoreductase